MNPQMFKGIILHFLKIHTQHHRPPNSYLISLFFSSTRHEPARSEPSIETLDYLVKEHSFSLRAAMKASSTITHLKNPKHSDSIISFFKEIGLTKTHVEELVGKAPRILLANLDNTIRPKINLFRDSGFSPADIADFLSNDPWIFFRSVDNRIGPSITALKSVLGSNVQVCRLLKNCGSFLKCDLEKTMLPNIEYLKSIGICSSRIGKSVFNHTRFYLLKPESLQALVRSVDEMGFNRKSNMFLYAIVVRSSMSEESWKSKLKLFQSLGLSESDVLDVFRRSPMVFAIAPAKIKEATELLLSAGKCDISYVIKHPYLLTYSVERRLKPRLQLLHVLEDNNLLQEWPPLSSVCSITDRQFQKRFVSPYSDALLGQNLILGRS